MKKAKILIQRGQKEYVEDLNKHVTIVKERNYYVENLTNNFSSDVGNITNEDLNSVGVIKSSKGKELCIFDASFVDVYKHLARLPQVIPLKDIGYILMQTGIGKDSIVVEGGAGSGGLGIQLARFAKKVYSYDIRKDHLELVKQSAKDMGVEDNMEIKEASLYEGIDEKDVDVICFDVPEPWHAVKHAVASLKVGGFLVSYSPTIIQSNQFVNQILDNHDNMIHLRTTEILDRPWLAEHLRVRPISKELLHSGFITIARKIC